MNKKPEPISVEETKWQYRSIFDAVYDGIIINDLETGLVVEANPAACRMHGYAREDFVGRLLTTFILPDDQHVFNEFIRAFQVDGTFEGQVLHVRLNGSTFYAAWRGSVFTYQGRACLLGVIRDVTKRVHSEKLLHQRVETRTLEQSKLLEISHTLASTLEFHPNLLLGQLHEIIAYSQGGLFSLDDSTLVALAMQGTPSLEQASAVRIRLDGPEILAAIFNGHRPLCIPDIWADDPKAQFLRTLLNDGAAVLLEGMLSWIWVPLAVKGRVLGGLGLAHQTRNFFTPHYAELALSAANLVAITMVNAELYKNAQALAVFEERQRLARNLHDAINQSLFSAGLIAEVLPRLWERDQVEARISIQDLLRLMRGAQAEMRALLAELRPSTLTDSNLGDLLHLLGNALSGRTNLPITVTILDDFMLPSEVQITFYRICQEALFNIAKHSQAKQVEIVLKRVEGVVELRIRDDGIGFDPAKIVQGHYGLTMMRERALAVGALFSVESQPGQGTELMIQWTQRLPKEVS